MRIAVFVDHFPSLSETFILNQIAGLIERGHQVDIFANRRGDTERIHPVVEKYNLLQHTFCPELPANKFQRVLGVFSILFANPQIRLTQWLSCLNVFAYGSRALNLRLFYDVARFLDKQPYDIIHCQLESIGLQGMLFRSMGFLKGRLVTSWRGHDFPTYTHKFASCTYSNLYDQGDAFLPVSESLKKELIENGCSEGKITVLRSGIDLEEFPFATRVPRQNGEIRILSIGRLVENKGIEYGIRAVAKLIEKNPRIRYRAIGDGPLKSQLRGLVEQLKLQNYVTLLGWKLKEEVVQELQEAVILATPSFTAADNSKEGIPNVLKEAMAMGVPVIGTEHSGIPELITEGDTGFLVPERDADALASKIDYLLSHPEIWEPLGRAARAHIESFYDIEKLNDELVEIYESLL
jgi:colanic acid/amylovoran biosynthesis glycosyltransferase